MAIARCCAPEHAPELTSIIRGNPLLEVETAAEDFSARIENKTLRAAIEFPNSFETRVAAEEVSNDLAVRIYYYEGEIRSEFALRTLREILRSFRDDLVEQRLAARSIE